MTDATLQASPEQRAALTVHALSGADREWLLQALPPQQQLRMRALLSELQAIGIPQDRELVRFIVHGPTAAASRSPRAGEADPATLMRFLAAEPPRVLRALLAASSSPLGTQVTSLCNPAQLAAARDCAPAAPALQAAVCEEVARRLPSSPASSPASSRWRRLRALLHRPRHAS